ncbi:hypothetical protein GJ496_001529 [Pomphorhynchus laevis]|nr:hypothetical protein GJ496_001529 [Pomphorhynchus laevis]
MIQARSTISSLADSMSQFKIQQRTLNKEIDDLKSILVEMQGRIRMMPQEILELLYNQRTLDIPSSVYAEPIESNK